MISSSEAGTKEKKSSGVYISELEQSLVGTAVMTIELVNKPVPSPSAVAITVYGYSP